MSFGQVTVSWNQSGEADLAGYRVYAGMSPMVLTLLQDVGFTATPNAPSVTLTQFPFYGILYFGVTAYDTSNNESAFSVPIAKGVAPVIFPVAWP